MIIINIMPYRRTLIVPGETYHVFNRSVARQPIFLGERDYLRALETVYFYNFKRPTLRYSHYNRLPQKQKEEFQSNLEKTERQVMILAFCLMPNHFHFLIREVMEKGIAIFVQNFQNSYAKYFNTKTERNGSLFQSRFKAVRIETDEQLVYVGRYIHLNPLTSYLIKEAKELETYPWCSFASFLDQPKFKIISSSELTEVFPSIEDFKNFR